MSRWTEQERTALGELRERCKDRLEKRLQLPEVVGDRRLLRFIRGHNFNMDKVVQKFTSFLDFRDANNVDAIRNEILYKPLSTPLEFPNGRKIINLIPQIVLAHDALDKNGNPMSMEEFGFNPELVMKSVNKEEFLRFIIYTLEYRVLVLEQLSDEKEKAFLSQFPEGEDGHRLVPPDTPPYGVILQCCTIRDFGKFGLDNVSTDGRNILSWILGVAMDNYPELLFRSHFINVPWIFNTLWAFVKGLIDPNTLRKMTMSSDGGMDKLLADLPAASIPRRLGGLYDGFNTPFTFNVAENGPFHYLGRPVFAVVADSDNMAAARAYIEQFRAAEKAASEARAGDKKSAPLVVPQVQLAVTSPSIVVHKPSSAPAFLALSAPSSSSYAPIVRPPVYNPPPSKYQLPPLPSTKRSPGGAPSGIAAASSEEVVVAIDKPTEKQAGLLMVPNALVYGLTFGQVNYFAADVASSKSEDPTRHPPPAIS